MQLTLYTNDPSPVHSLHPATKLLATLVLFTTVFLSERPAALGPLVAGVLILLWLSGGFANLRRLRVIFAMVFLMTLIIWTLFYPGPGEAILAFGPLAISREALTFAVAIAFKLTTFLAVGVLFLTVTKIEEFAYALTRMGIPFKFAFTVTLTFRLVPVFLDSATNVVQAQRCRGFDFDRGGLIQRVRNYVPVLVPVFIGALRRADGMAVALEARGFQAKGKRTSLTAYGFGAPDVVALAATSGVMFTYYKLWSLGLTTL